MLISDNLGYSPNAYKRSVTPYRKFCSTHRRFVTYFAPGYDPNVVRAAITAGVIYPFTDDDLVSEHYGRHIAQAPVHLTISGRSRVGNSAILDIFPNCRDHEASYIAEDAASDLRSWLVEPEYSAEQRGQLILDGKQRRIAIVPTGGGRPMTAILVDEGRDFHTIALQALRLYLRPGGEFLVAEDQLQDIYKRGRKLDARLQGAWLRTMDRHSAVAIGVHPI